MSEENRLSNSQNDGDLRRIFESTIPKVPKVDFDELANRLPQYCETKGGLAVETGQSILSRGSTHDDGDVPSDLNSNVVAQSPVFDNRPTESRARLATSLLSLAIVVTLVVVVLRSLPEKAAFADVQARVEQLKTVQFTNYRTFPNDKGLQPRKLRVKILGRHLQVTEVIGQPGRYDLIDSKSGRMFTVDTIEKVFREIKKRIVIDSKTGLRTETEFQLPADVDFYQNITGFPERAFQHLGPGLVGEQPATRFKRVFVNGLATRTVSIWADVQTHLPLHIEIQLRSKDPAVEPVDFTYTDFVYDEPLDRSLFSTNPPFGFKEVDGEFIERN